MRALLSRPPPPQHRRARHRRRGAFQIRLLPGKSRAPWTTVRCSMRSLWAWTGATLGSPKLTGLCSTLGAPAPSPAHVSKATMVTRPEPPPHFPRMSYRPVPRSSLPARAPSLPGKSRAPWTTVLCSMRSLWAWTGATLGSPKLTGLRSTLGAPAPSPAHVSKTTMVTRPEPLPHGPRTAYRPVPGSSLPARAPTLPGKVPCRTD